MIVVTSPTATVRISDVTITGGDAVGADAPQAQMPNPGQDGGDAIGGILDQGKLTLSA